MDYGKPPVLIIDGEVQLQLPEHRTTYSALLMISMMNDAQRNLVHSFVASIYNLGQIQSSYLDLTDLRVQGTDAEH
jgi:hypothetical protein